MNNLEIAELFDEAADYWGIGEKLKPNELAQQLKAWGEDLSEFSYEQVSDGIRAYRCSKDAAFFPKTGQIIQYIVKMQPENDFPGEQEALAMVIKAAENGIYGSKEEFAKLPPIVQKAVGTPKQLEVWGSSQDPSHVWHSQFLRSYRDVLNRVNEERSLPQNKRFYTNSLTEKAAATLEITQKDSTPVLEYHDYSPKGKAQEAVRKMMESLRAEA